jgi:hypothetical protein
MHDVRKFAVLALSMVLLPARWTFGGEYSDPSGFSFTYPEGWFVAKSAHDAKDSIQVPPEIKSWMEKNNVDLGKASVILVRQGDEDFLENLNVVVTNGELAVSEHGLNELLKMLPQQYASIGAQVDHLEGRVQKHGANDTLVVDFQSKLPVVDTLLRQRQVFIPGGGKSFIVTCTGPAAKFGKYVPTFETIVASFKVPAPIGQGIDWVRVLRAGVTFGILGGVIGGLVGLFKKLANAGKSKAA